MEHTENLYLKLLRDAVQIFNNYDRTKGITQRYTSGRDIQGLLNGTLTVADIDTLIVEAGKQGIAVDTLVMPGAVWAVLVRNRMFQKYLYNPMFNIVPTQLLPEVQGAQTGAMLGIDSYNLKAAAIIGIKLNTENRIVEDHPLREAFGYNPPHDG